MEATQASRAANPPRMLPGFNHINRYWDDQHDMFAAKLLPGTDAGPFIEAFLAKREHRSLAQDVPVRLVTDDAGSAGVRGRVRKDEDEQKTYQGSSSRKG